MSKEKNQVKRRDPASRWTKPLTEVGWTPVSDYFLHYYAEIGITSAEAMFIVHLMSFKWDEDAPFPGFKTIAQRMGVTDTQARTYARSLQKKGFLFREFRKSTTNIFHLDDLFRRLEKHVEAKTTRQKVAS